MSTISLVSFSCNESSTIADMNKNIYDHVIQHDSRMYKKSILSFSGRTLEISTAFSQVWHHFKCIVATDTLTWDGIWKREGVYFLSAALSTVPGAAWVRNINSSEWHSLALLKVDSGRWALAIVGLAFVHLLSKRQENPIGLCLLLVTVLNDCLHCEYT